MVERVFKTVHVCPYCYEEYDDPSDAKWCAERIKEAERVMR